MQSGEIGRACHVEHVAVEGGLFQELLTLRDYERVLKQGFSPVGTIRDVVILNGLGENFAAYCRECCGAYQVSWSRKVSLGRITLLV